MKASIGFRPAARALIFAAIALLPAYGANNNVFDIFADHCYGCHSADVKMGGLDLHTPEGILKGGQDGKVIVPGKSAESRLFLMISGKLAPQMPMAGPKLTSEDIAAIGAWIDAGAKMPAANEIHTVKTGTLPPIQPRVPVKPVIYDLAWSPDGATIAIAGFREVRLVEAAGKKQIAKLEGPPDAVRAVAFSRDGSLLAAAGGLPARGGEVDLYDVASRKLLRSIKGHADCIYAVAFSPDGKSIATSSYDKLIKLWDVASGKEIRTLKDHIDAVYALAFTPDGARIVSGAADRTIKIWNVATGERLYTLSEPQDGINAVALDPTGKYVAAAGDDKTIRIWSLGDKSGKLVNSLIAHEESILRLSWSPDGKYLASSSADKTVKTYTVPDLVEQSSYTEPDWVYGLEFSPRGSSLAIGSFNGSLTVTATHEVGQAVSPASSARVGGVRAASQAR